MATFPVRYPRAWLVVGKARLETISATVNTKAEHDASTFSAELSIQATAPFGFDYARWADWQGEDVQIVMCEAADQSDARVMIVGTVDTPHIHWENSTVTVSGRGKASSLTEKRRSQQFKNQKSGDIVSTIAQDHGLTAVTEMTGDFAGKLYDVDAVHLLMNLSDHEILARLAEREGFRWYVEGTNLHFEPKGTTSGTFNVVWIPPGRQAPFGIATCTDLETHRNMTAARPHDVTVRSFNHKDKKHYDGKASADGIGASVEVEHHHNGRNQSQVDKLSKSRLKDAIKHDCNVVVRMPGDLGVTVQQKLALSGTGTIYDQLYDIPSVEHEIAWGTGFDMTICGRIAKAGRTGTDNSGSTKIQPAPKASTDVPLPPERPAGIGTNSNATPVTTPAGSGGIGSA